MASHFLPVKRFYCAFGIEVSEVTTSNKPWNATFVSKQLGSEIACECYFNNSVWTVESFFSLTGSSLPFDPFLQCRRNCRDVSSPEWRQEVRNGSGAHVVSEKATVTKLPPQTKFLWPFIGHNSILKGYFHFSNNTKPQQFKFRWRSRLREGLLCGHWTVIWISEKLKPAQFKSSV